MSVWDTLAEARIREWLARPAAERAAAQMPLDPAVPLEVQLQSDIAQLDRMAVATESVEESAAMRRRASELMLRLAVLLESEGRPLAARAFAEQRRANRDRDHT